MNYAVIIGLDKIVKFDSQAENIAHDFDIIFKLSS